MKQVMVIAPHPDDETLGCGGTILKLKEEDIYVCWVIVTNIVKESELSIEKVNARQEEIDNVARFYKFDDVFKLNFPTTKLDTFSIKEIIDSLDSVINKVKPDTIFIPNRSDVHSDHRITFNAAISCTKIFKTPFVKNILMYEVISETEFSPQIPSCTFVPNSFCNITDHIEQKIEAMSMFAGEMGKHPFPRSEKMIRALATLRGEMAGHVYAEAFQVLKEIW
ncbi:MAG: PIG-L family deacetylase [Lentimicrobiaceae bacterium]|jgi:N-acetylglucosamine malate deacetylase 1|nr:PIG-L family deacetylase [Candidatus Scalindua sp.]MBT6671581.1 PIG-L family deacetylase [Lentimicrobiaceae bacterium]